MASLDAVTDFVSVRDLSVRAVIGVHAWEREIEQTLVVSVDMAADVRKAAASDDLADALDYSAVAETIAALLRDGKFRLIETAAERVAGRLLADLPLIWLRLELRKPITSAPTPYTAVITIERTREIS
jgi:7,8-dihydroneopterin aldolase/epimerase/oxygenase